MIFITATLADAAAVGPSNVYATILTTPPNYSFVVDRLYVVNAASTVFPDNMAFLYELKNSSVGITGTTLLTQLSQESGANGYLPDREALRVSTNSILVGISVNGYMSVTLGGRYEYYRE